MQNGAGDEPLIVFSDYACPFCYLGKASLERWLASRPDPPPVEWHPFDLRARQRGPDGRLDPRVDDPRDEGYYARADEGVERLRRLFNVPMASPLPRRADSWNAHKAALYVRRAYPRPVFDAYHTGVYDALWRDGRDIGDLGVLDQVALEAGAEPKLLRAMLDDADLDRALRELVARAHEYGIRAVPSFVYRGRGVRGAVPPEDLDALVTLAASDGASTPPG